MKALNSKMLRMFFVENIRLMVDKIAYVNIHTYLYIHAHARAHTHYVATNSACCN